MATVGERFQLVIERDVRRKLGVRAGDRAVEVTDGERLIVTFIPARHSRSLRGVLAGSGRVDDFAAYRDAGILSDALAAEAAEEAAKD